LKILQIYELNPLESIGGVEIAILNLTSELADRGHEVTILTGAGNGGGIRRLDNGFRVITHDFLSTMERSYVSGRLSLFRQLMFLSSIAVKKPDLKFDLYHGHIYSSGLLACQLADKNNGISVNTIHGSYYPVWHKLKNPLSAAFYRSAERRLATSLSKKANLQIHVSTYFADQVSKWGGGMKIKVIPNGVDTNLFNPKTDPIVESSKPVILTARRLVRKNGVEYLIKAMQHLGEDCRLLIIGDGPERGRLEKLAESSQNVEFLGEVPHNEVPSYLACADVAVVPSIIEASSLFMLEAMAMGKPVIASSVGGLPEILGDCGTLVPPANPRILEGAISQLLQNPEKIRKYGTKGLKRVKENFTWQHVASRIESEYLRLWGEMNA
jgi:glycosyltransferase involved in cell wall biosynthesis